ncbi:phiSA1p31-related protein [Streptomyces sp. NPDC015414]|uniref:phiSA1p31-related protein n=1 Tax=Streptomyces sp. NPDC015414 TaxID=3364957 RepID=UPI00370117D4
MAEATQSVRTVTTEVKTFTLTLSPEEFEWLKDVVGAAPFTATSRSVWEAVKSPANGDVYTYEGVSYDLTAKYLDTSGDTWEFTGARDSSGQPLLTCPGAGDGYANWSLRRLVAQYITLRKA